MRRKKIAVIATHPIQYQVPIWASLASQTALDVHVYYGSDFSIRGYYDRGFGETFNWDVPLLEGYAHTFLSRNPSINGADDFFSLRASGLAEYLRGFNPDCALINAYMPFFWWEAFAILRAHHIPVLLRAEATDVALSRNASKRLIRNILLHWFYNRCACCLAIGVNARLHYLAHGVPAQRIGWAPYCVDNALIEEQVSRYGPQRKAIRSELGFDEGDTIFIYSGKLIEKKDPVTLARALKGMSEDEQRRIGIIIMGEGVLRSQLEREFSGIFSSKIIFTGFVNQSRIGFYYAAADCLVLPSVWGETWGLVVNEAMQFGLPVIVSDRVGCQPDLVVEGNTGYVFQVGDAVELKTKMLKIKNMPIDARQAVSLLCRSRVGDYTVQKAVEGIVRGVMDL